MPFMDLERARKEMQKRGVDALVATTPTNFYYTSMLRSGLSEAPAITIIPADPAHEPAVLVLEFDGLVARKTSNIKDIWTYPMWMEIVEAEDIPKGTIKRVPKPHQFDLRGIYAQLSDIFKEKGLHGGTIGIEMGSFIQREYPLLLEYNPKAKFVDAEEIFWELRKIKTKEEIENLKIAAAITVKGIQGMIEGGVLGATIGELQAKYKKGVVKAMTDDIATRFDFRYSPIAVGDPFSTFYGSAGPGAHKVAKGDIIYIDCGVYVNGYMSDMGRTFVVGKPSSLPEKIYRALRTGYEEALSKVKPGMRMNEIYNIAQDTVRKSGLDWYTRGHLGHSVGCLGPPIENPPFFAADDETELEANMVVCLETPLYVKGLGAFQIEDMLLITPGGYERLTDIPRDLVEL